MGSYTVIGSINSSNYVGSATNTLVITKALATLTLTNLSQNYTGSGLVAGEITMPAGLIVGLTYDGSDAGPTNVGSYTVVGTVTNANYYGGATNTLVINKALATVTLTNLSQTYSATAIYAGSSTTPGGLMVTLTYNGSTAAPTNPGSYLVIGTVVDANYAGSATNILIIVPGTASASYTINFNPATGLYEELVNVTNNSGATMGGVEFLVSNLTARVSLYQATGTNHGLPFVKYTTPLAANSSAQYLLQFYNPYRIAFTNTVLVLALPPANTVTGLSSGVPLSQVYVDRSNPSLPRFSFAFASTVGTTYQIYYSSDLMNWTQAATVTASSRWTICTEAIKLIGGSYFRVIPQVIP